MKRSLSLISMIVLLLSVIGCQSMDGSHENNTFKASGDKGKWSVNTNFEVADELFSEQATLTYTGEDIPQNIEFTWIFPDEMGIGSSGTIQNKDNLREFETATGGSSISDGQDLAYFKENMNNTLIRIEWNVDGTKYTTEVPLNVNE